MKRRSQWVRRGVGQRQSQISGWVGRRAFSVTYKADRGRNGINGSELSSQDE